MRTLLLVMGSWTVVSALLVITYAIGAAAGHRRARLHIDGPAGHADDAEHDERVIRLLEMEEHYR